MSLRAQFHVVVVGGGISGLVSAYLLGRQGHRVTLLEKTGRLGGLFLTEQQGVFQFEAGPDSFVAQKPAALELCRELGLESELVSSRPDQAGAWVWSRGTLHRFPGGIFMRAPVPADTLLEASVLSPDAKAAVRAEPTRGIRAEPGETVADFFARSLGSEVLECIVEPLVTGVYGTAPEDLELDSAFPRLSEFSRRNGYFTQRGVPAPVSGATFMTPREGIQRLTDAVRSSLGSGVHIRTGERVVNLSLGGSRPILALESGEQLTCDAVILAVPASAASRLLSSERPQLAGWLAEIRYSPALIGCLGYPSEVIPKELSGTGFLVPRVEKRTVTACTFVHRKFPGRCPEGGGLLRAFVSGAVASQLWDRTDGEVLHAMRKDLSELIGVDAKPAAMTLFRWDEGLPGYSPGHGERVGKIEAALQEEPSLALVGNYFDGVGISDCIRHARRSVARILTGPAGSQSPDVGVVTPRLRG